MLIAERITLHRPNRRLSLWKLFNLARQRRALGQLSGEALKDVGISQAEAHEEANRPIWDVPRNWRCR